VELALARRTARIRGHSPAWRLAHIVDPRCSGKAAPVVVLPLVLKSLINSLWLELRVVDLLGRMGVEVLIAAACAAAPH
jgi:hypothetical protein